MNQRKAKRIREEVGRATDRYVDINSRLPKHGLFRRLYGDAKRAYLKLPRKDRNKFVVI